MGVCPSVVHRPVLRLGDGIGICVRPVRWCRCRCRRRRRRSQSSQFPPYCRSGSGQKTEREHGDWSGRESEREGERRPGATKVEVTPWRSDTWGAKYPGTCLFEETIPDSVKPWLSVGGGLLGPTMWRHEGRSTQYSPMIGLHLYPGDEGATQTALAQSNRAARCFARRPFKGSSGSDGHDGHDGHLPVTCPANRPPVHVLQVMAGRLSEYLCVCPTVDGAERNVARAEELLALAVYLFFLLSLDSFGQWRERSALNLHMIQRNKRQHERKKETMKERGKLFIT